MLDKSTPWVAAAWQHWHRPWAVMHRSWIESRHAAFVGDASQEPLLRLHYPAWCRAYAIDVRLTEFSDSVWWRLFGLPPAAYERAAQLVGWTLLFAADPPRRLVRRGLPMELDAARWALGRAHFVPTPVLDWVHAAMAARHADDLAERLASCTLRRCVPDEEPALWPRIRMRLARAPEIDEGVPVAMQGQAQMHIASLWGSAVRHAAPHAATGRELAAPQEATA